MSTIHPDSFAMVCFLVLIQNGGGLMDKSPDYITEKTHMLRAGLEAFSYLDIHNMRKVIAWCDSWGVEVPELVKEEMGRQERALAELNNLGLDL